MDGQTKISDKKNASSELSYSETSHRNFDKEKTVKDSTFVVKYTSSGCVSENSKGMFTLAPTPAQLGKAPLQKRQSLGMYDFLTILRR